MRRIPRVRQASLLAVAPLQCTCAAPATLPIAAMARRTLSTTPARQNNERVRKLMWKDGDAPGPQDPYDQEAAKALKQQQIELELAEAEAELAEFEANNAQPARPQRRDGKPPRPPSRLKTKNPRTRAPTEKEVETQGYIPAKTVDELEEVAGLAGWWDQEGHWGKESEYVGFSPRGIAQKITDKNVCEALVRQAVIEAVAVGQLAKEEQLKGTWAKGDRASFDRAMSLGITISKEDNVVIGGKFKDARQLAHHLGQIKKDQTAGVEEIIAPEEAEEMVKSFDKRWTEISLKDPRFKFAVHKRVFQLTGNYVHDAKLAQIDTVGQLISAIVTPPKPTKVAEAVREGSDLLNLPNVQVHDRRVTPIDKEIAVGRWKVIEEELKKRGLPITGHEHLGRPVQRKWIQGKA